MANVISLYAIWKTAVYPEVTVTGACDASTYVVPSMREGKRTRRDEKQAALPSSLGPEKGRLRKGDSCDLMLHMYIHGLMSISVGDTLQSRNGQVVGGGERTASGSTQDQWKRAEDCSGVV